MKGIYNLYEFSVEDGELVQKNLKQSLDPFYSEFELREMTK